MYICVAACLRTSLCVCDCKIIKIICKIIVLFHNFFFLVRLSFAVIVLSCMRQGWRQVERGSNASMRQRISCALSVKPWHSHSKRVKLLFGMTLENLLSQVGMGTKQLTDRFVKNFELFQLEAFHNYWLISGYRRFSTNFFLFYVFGNFVVISHSDDVCVL